MRGAIAIDGDVESQHASRRGHGRERTRVIRPIAYGAREMERLRSLSEDECYLRCYGRRGADDSVRVVPVRAGPSGRDPRREQSEAGERLRRLLELRIDARESFEAA